MATLSQKLQKYRAGQNQKDEKQQLQDLEKLTLKDLEKEKIEFGRAKLGQKFPEAFQDGKWTDWFCQQYETSGKVQHQKYIRYVSLKLDQEIKGEKVKSASKTNDTMGYTAMQAASSEQEWMRFKEEHGVESEASLHLDDASFTHVSQMEDQMAQVSQLEEQMVMMQQESQNTQHRMTQIEMALQEIIGMLKIKDENHWLSQNLRDHIWQLPIR